MERTVPLVVQADKWYVMKDGTVVRTEAHESESEYFFKLFGLDGAHIKGGFCTNSGAWWETGMPCPKDLARPLYSPGQHYVMRNGGTVYIKSDDGSDTYPLSGDDNYSTDIWMRDGRFDTDHPNSGSDLLDYAAQPKLAGNKASLIIVDEVQETKQMKSVTDIGARVEYMDDGVRCIGTVVAYDVNNCTIEFDTGSVPSGAWDCHGKVPSKRGYLVHPDYLTLSVTYAPKGWDVAETGTDAAPVIGAPVKLLPREDRKLLWDLFLSNNRTTYTLTQLIDLRRELDAACER